jgi:fructose-1,6-bisphosphatase II / sedoheptulose-1,7-bisphosphatase
MRLTKTQEGRSPAAIDRSLTLEVVRITERAAIAAAGWRGKGDEKSADRAAVAAMRAEMDRVHFDARIVIGEGDEGETDILYVGEEVGQGGAAVDIAVDPLEGTTLCAKNQPDSLCVLAMAERGGLLRTPDVYMTKIAIGAGYPEGLVDLDASPADNLGALARAKGVPVREITACVLDRPRHGDIIEAIRLSGAGIKLISDGDIAGVIHATNPDETGIDIYLGSGGAREGVLAAAALRCVGGFMQGRLVLDTPDKRERAARVGITEASRKYAATDLASGDVMFTATGVTDGSMLEGVRVRRDGVLTSTIVMRSWSGTVRWIKALHAR